jgi:hypothetical protein
LKILGTTKIGKPAPKPGFIYPTIRLPHDCADLIGENVKLYATEHEGRQTFLVVIDKGVAQPVAQPFEEIVPNTYNERIIELEKRIRTVEGRGFTIYPALSSERAVSPPPCKGDVIPLDHEADELLMSPLA